MRKISSIYYFLLVALASPIKCLQDSMLQKEYSNHQHSMDHKKNVGRFITGTHNMLKAEARHVYAEYNKKHASANMSVRTSDNQVVVMVNEQNKTAIAVFEISAQMKPYTLTAQEITRAKEMFDVCKVETRGGCKVITFQYADKNLLPETKEQALFLLYSPYLRDLESPNYLAAQVLGSNGLPINSPLNKAQTNVVYAKDAGAEQGKHISLRDQMLAKAALCKEGLIGSTAIKTEKGYCKIEELKAGDRVACYDAKNSKQTHSIVTHADTLHVSKYIEITINDQVIGVAPGHKFYVQSNDATITAQDLKDSPFLWELVDSRIQDVQEIDQPLDVVRITIDEHHNFYITEHDILVHNYGAATFKLFAIIGKAAPTIYQAVKGIIGGWIVYKTVAKQTQENSKNTPEYKYVGGVDYFQEMHFSVEDYYQKQDTQKIKEQPKVVQPAAKELPKTATGGGPQLPKDPENNKDKNNDSEKTKDQNSTKTVDDLIKDSKPLKKTRESNNSSQYERPGDFKDAYRDFQSLKPSDIKDIPTGKRGTLPDGRSVNVRIDSSYKKPTLEIINFDDTRIKFRYGDQ